MKKYIQDSLMLTKEAFNEYILKQRESQAASFGLTLEQYEQAVISGSVLTQQLPTSSISTPNIGNFL
jgi:hypothetical protein